MELLYKKEHLECPYYEGGKRPTIELLTLSQNESWKRLPLENKLVFMLDGEISFSFGKFTDCIMQKGKMLYLPANFNFSCNALKNSLILIIRLHDRTHFCDSFRVEDLMKYSDMKRKNPELCSIVLEDVNEDDLPAENQKACPDLLEVNEPIEQYLNFLYKCVTVGLNCKFFFQIKVKELFYLFRCFYSKDTLTKSFHYALNGGNEFSAFIIQNAHKYKSVGELAEAMNYTISGFEKRFKRIFKISPYKWMTNNKAEKIFHEISTTEETFKQISSNFGFSSSSHFNDFCKLKFGKTPREIRIKCKIGENQE